MITFSRNNELIILNYIVDYGDEEWVPRVLKENGAIRLKKSIYLEETLYIPVELLKQEEEDEEGIFDSNVYRFRFAKLEQGYFKIFPNVLTRRIDVFFHESVELDISYFVADTTTPIFRLLEDLVNEPIYISGEYPAAIPIEAFKSMVKGFPTPYEKKIYAEARISSILKNYLDSTKDSEMKFQLYMNKKISRQGNNLKKTFKEAELVKYLTILEKLNEMLEDEQGYSEKKWQLEILQIIQLLYPKYISVLSNVPIRDKFVGDRILDFLLVDVNGHIDIIEIKKPFDNSIMTQGKHRNNHIPLRELSGTIMQLEKYIFFLTRWGANGETYLTNKYSEELPDDMEIKITNPSGIIIMGREKALTPEQYLDFEVVKRKYKNVVDIITYDNLVYRLKIIIDQITKI